MQDDRGAESHRRPKVGSEVRRRALEVCASLCVSVQPEVSRCPEA